MPHALVGHVEGFNATNDVTLDLTSLAGSDVVVACVMTFGAAAANGDPAWQEILSGPFYSVWACFTPGSSTTFEAAFGSLAVHAVAVGFTGTITDVTTHSALDVGGGPLSSVPCPDVSYPAGSERSVLAFPCLMHIEYAFDPTPGDFTPAGSISGPYTTITSTGEHWTVHLVSPTFDSHRVSYIGAAWRPNLGTAAATVTGAVDSITGNSGGDDETWEAFSIVLTTTIDCECPEFEFTYRWMDLYDTLLSPARTTAIGLLEVNDRALEDNLAARCGATPFHFPYRWTDITGLLFSGDPHLEDLARALLEDNDRALEDHLANRPCYGGHCLFEYPYRWPTIATLLLSAAPQHVRTAVALLEDRYRALEDHLHNRVCHA